MKEENKPALLANDETFEDYIRNARDSFSMVMNSGIADNIKLKVAAKDIIIAYDQIRDKLAGYKARTEPQPIADVPNDELKFSLKDITDAFLSGKLQPLTSCKEYFKEKFNIEL